jgi:hypothetical protein
MHGCCTAITSWPAPCIARKYTPCPSTVCMCQRLFKCVAIIALEEDVVEALLTALMSRWAGLATQLDCIIVCASITLHSPMSVCHLQSDEHQICVASSAQSALPSLTNT